VSFKGFIALVGLALIAVGCQQQFGAATACVVSGAILLASAVIDAVVEPRRPRH
jgi:hypothetical protein